MITAERVRELFNYNPTTGLFTRRIAVGRHGRHREGDIAGTDNKNGYIRIIVDRKKHYAHRLAWLYVYGYMPSGIDHADRNPSNNRITNLRAATQSQNLANTPTPSHNTSGLKGVHWSKQNQKWIAQINLNGQNIYLGGYDDIQKARAVYVEEAKRLFGEFARVTASV